MGQSELFELSRLDAWAPQRWSVAPDWRPLVDSFLRSSEGQSLARVLTQRLASGALIYPARPLRALELTPLARVRVVILGQDPYHGPGQAEGLAFSVARGVPLPPSLRNIYKELARDPALAPWVPPEHGSLVSWAEQGVLLLNTCLTVEDGQPASHAKLGWEALTNEIIRVLAIGEQPITFLLWGAHAQKVAAQAGLSDGAGAHQVLTANHPSPLSAMRPPVPFLGCGHFSMARDFLSANGRGELRW